MTSEDRPPDDVVASGVSVRFGGLWALRHVNMSVPSGTIVGLVGPNGAGKSSLLNCISGVYPADEGVITFGGQRLSGQRPDRIAALGIGRTFQNIELVPDANVITNILFGRHLHVRRNVFGEALGLPSYRKQEAHERERVEEIIEFLEIEDLRHRTVGTLSVGQQKRVDLGRALATEPRVLLLDEPSSGMNREEKEDMARFILRLKRVRNLTQLLVEHDVRFIRDLCDTVVALDFGEVIAAGTSEEVFENERVVTAYLGRARVEADAEGRGGT